MSNSFRKEAGAEILRLLTNALGLNDGLMGRQSLTGEPLQRIPDGAEGGDHEFSLSMSMTDWAVADGLGIDGPMIRQIAMALEARVRNHTSLGRPDQYVRDHWTNKLGRAQAPQAIIESDGWFVLIYPTPAGMTITFPCKVSTLVLR